MEDPLREREESESESIFQRPKGNLQFFAHRPSGERDSEWARGFSQLDSLEVNFHPLRADARTKPFVSQKTIETVEISLLTYQPQEIHGWAESGLWSSWAKGTEEGGGQLLPASLCPGLSTDGRRFNFLFVAVGSVLDDGTVGFTDIQYFSDNVTIQKCGVPSKLAHYSAERASFGLKKLAETDPYVISARTLQKLSCSHAPTFF